MDYKEVQFIRKSGKKLGIDFTQHAMDQLNQRKIDISLVKNAIMKGKVIEKQDKERDIKILFQEATEDVPRFAVSVAATMPPKVVTVYKFYKDEWKYDPSNEIMKRRRD